MVNKNSPNKRLKQERLARGWTQKRLAGEIETTDVNISRWENGVSQPSFHFRNRLCEIFKKDQYELGFIQEDEKSPLDEHAGQMRTTPQQPVVSIEVSMGENRWGLPDSGKVYGREAEIETILQWIIEDRSHLIMLTGLGGVGKTSLAVTIAECARKQFDFLLWCPLYPLQNPPSPAKMIQHCMQQLTQQFPAQFPQDIDDQIFFLTQYLLRYRCLLIFDNFESLLQEGDHRGIYRKEYEGYAQFLRHIVETRHQSCLLLSSREMPADFSRMEGKTTRAHALRLQGLSPEAGRKILQDYHLKGSDTAWRDLIDHYSGNPLALKLVSPAIQHAFSADIAAFLQENKFVLGTIQTLLEQQFLRLSELEQQMMYYLAAAQKVVLLHEIHDDQATLLSMDMLIDVLTSLRRRSMVEVDTYGYFSLQPVIMEYVVERLVMQMYHDIVSERLQLLSSLALVKAQAPRYIRTNQIQSILQPLLKKLCLEPGKEESERKLRALLTLLRTKRPMKAHYAAGNILNMLIQLQADLREADFSYLPVHQAYLQEALLPHVNFAYANLSTSVFAHALGSILCVKFSPDAKVVAIGTTRGEIFLHQAAGDQPLVPYRGHTDAVRSIDFHPTKTLLLSGSQDRTARLWDTTTGDCIRILRGHTGPVRSVALSPDGCLAASGSEDQTVRLWDIMTGSCLHVLSDNLSWVESVVFSPGGNTLASCSGTTITLWDGESGYSLKTLRGHIGVVRALAFSADGMLLASCSKDRTVRIWNTPTAQCRSVLEGHSGYIRSVAFSADNTLLATGSDDNTIRIWEVRTGRCLKVLQEHHNRVWSVAFSPHHATLVSGSEDQTVRFWESETGRCFKMLQGYSNQIWSIACHPHDTLVASGNEDRTIHLWNTHTGQQLAVLAGHTHRVRTVTFSPDGRYLASGSEDRSIRLWETSTMQCLNVLEGHTHLVRSVAFSPDSNVLASSSHDRTVRLWETRTGQCLHTLHGECLINAVAFSKDGLFLASGNEDCTISVWEVQSSQRVSLLRGHTQRIWAIACSPDGRYLASSGDDQEVRLWELHTGRCIRILQAHTQWVRTLSFNHDGTLLASGSHDHTVRLWSVHTGQCLAVLQGSASWIWSISFNFDGSLLVSGNHDGAIDHWDVETRTHSGILRSERPYEGMNITGARGLTVSQKETLKALGAIEETEGEKISDK